MLHPDPHLYKKQEMPTRTSQPSTVSQSNHVGQLQDRYVKMLLLCEDGRTSPVHVSRIQATTHIDAETWARTTNINMQRHPCSDLLCVPRYGCFARLSTVARSSPARHTDARGIECVDISALHQPSHSLAGKAAQARCRESVARQLDVQSMPRSARSAPLGIAPRALEGTKLCATPKFRH